MNEGSTTACDDAPARRVSAADDDDQRPEPHAESDETPEEAGYGYGV